jgi:aminocarboxymuconate-semialdehyde decarboxylase
MTDTTPSPPIRKIDVHAHFLPSELPDMAARSGHGGWIALSPSADGRLTMSRDGEFFRAIEPNCFDVEARLADLDAQGLAMQALSTIPVMFGYQAAAADAAYLGSYLNDHLAGVVRDHPDRFVGLGTVPMQDPDLAVREMERCVHELGMAGIQIGTNVAGRNLDDPGVVAVLQAARDLDTAVLVHPWDMMAADRMGRHWLPWLVGMPSESALAIASMILGGVFDKVEGLRICFAHGGGSFPFILGRIEHGYAVRPDLVATCTSRPPRTYIDRFWVDTGVHDQLAFDYLLDVMGPRGICLGSDQPFPLGEHRPGEIVEHADVDEAGKRMMLEIEPSRFLGLELPADFDPESSSSSPTTSRETSA